ncbi:MAG: endonuclease/exonuclease/phosphatase family protein [Nocardioides sp.]
MASSRRRELTFGERALGWVQSVGILSAAAMVVTSLMLGILLNGPDQAQPSSASQTVDRPIDVSQMTPAEAREAISRAREAERTTQLAAALDEVVPGMKVAKGGDEIELTPAAQYRRLLARYRGKGMSLVPPSQYAGTSFRVASFNILGFDHTRPGGNHASFPDGYSRMTRAAALIRNTNLSVVGLQESQTEQIYAFRSRMPGWGIFPGTAGPEPKASQNSIVWNTAIWDVVETHTIIIPYFGWEPFPMPYVLLRHKESGREVWFANFHNPASVRGPAAGIRRAATAREAALANQLRADGTPVIFTGDFNDKSAFFCQIAAATTMRGSNGSYHDGSCQMRGPINIDWVIGTQDISFSEHVVDNYPRASRTSDHPMIRAMATLSPPSQREECSTEKLQGKTLYFCPDPGLEVGDEADR